MSKLKVDDIVQIVNPYMPENGTKGIIIKIADNKSSSYPFLYTVWLFSPFNSITSFAAVDLKLVNNGFNKLCKNQSLK